MIKKFRGVSNTLLLAVDGTGYFSSTQVHCDSCSHHRQSDGKTRYTHMALMAAIVAVDTPQVIALAPEFILSRDGTSKQDCELNAVKRWISQHGDSLSPLDVTILGDDLYSCVPVVDQISDAEMHFILTCKAKSHKHLFESIEVAKATGDFHEIHARHWTGREHRTITHRWVNAVPLRDGEDAPDVNWVEVLITDETGKITYHNSFITDLLISEENVGEIVQAGRTRWKIENEDFNTLKTKGYHFEHNYGHGKRYLSQTLLCLNILAFFCHTILEFCDREYSKLKETLPRRDMLFQHIATLTQYMYFANWRALMLFMTSQFRLSRNPA